MKTSRFLAMLISLLPILISSHCDEEDICANSELPEIILGSEVSKTFPTMIWYDEFKSEDGGNAYVHFTMELHQTLSSVSAGTIAYSVN